MDIYSPLHKSAFFMIQSRQRIFRRIFADHFPSGKLDNLKLLEIGCGNGQWLAEFQTFGFNVNNLSGIELDTERTAAAQKRIIGADIRSGTAAELPWDDNHFDIVFQSTVFTSVLDDSIRQKIAFEMHRVCRKDGFILWYDFMFNNPKNQNVKGIAKKQVSELFSNCQCTFQTTTLAPPIARRLVPISWFAADLLESLCPFLRTHLISVIKKI